MKKKLNIKTQFFLSHMMIALISTVVVLIFFYLYISSILIERETASLAMMCNNFQSQTDAKLGTLDEVSLNICYNNLLFSKTNPYFERDLHNSDDFSELIQLLVSANGINFNAAQINIYSLDGQEIMVGNYTNKSQVDLSELPWIPAADAADGHKVISRPYATSNMLSSSRVSMDYISLYRAYHDSFGRKNGYIETIQTCKKIFQGIISYHNSTGKDNGVQVYVYDSTGALMYPYRASDQPDPEFSRLLFERLASIPSGSPVSVKDPQNGKTIWLTASASSYSDWIYVCIQQEDIILSPVYAFRNILLLVGVILFLIAFITSYIMSRRLTRPIHQLLNSFRRTSLETLGTAKKNELHSSFNEFDELNDAYTQLQQDLKTSMDDLLKTRQQELESRSLALQSQINPHFYYNSLSTIMILAENQQTEDVIRFSKNLSSMMRYITNGNLQVVTLEAEISYVQKYLYCMKTRYQSSLSYEIHVDQALYEQEIPKLLIQPMVENAIKYGTECDPPWSIFVEGRARADGWSITIRDRGPGFTQEALDTISRRFREADTTQGVPKLQINGLGMVNAYSRWRLFGGKQGFFRYGNHEAGGAYVTIGIDSQASKDSTE
ncbi:MAG: histidine kinase [Lachnospiraceae bacterium]|nr:histidine kinase [Lachnospiraceae bacterium]